MQLDSLASRPYPAAAPLMINLKLAAPRARQAVASAVAAIMTDILSPGRAPRPRDFRVPLTDPTASVRSDQGTEPKPKTIIIFIRSIWIPGEVGLREAV